MAEIEVTIYEKLRQLTALAECLDNDTGDIEVSGDEFNRKRINRVSEVAWLLHDSLHDLTNLYEQNFC